MSWLIRSNITIPTYLTFFRIVLIPCVVAMILLKSWAAALCIFSIAALTDLLDGMIARSFNLETDFGACLDPIADKLLLLSCFGALFYSENSMLIVPLWFLVFAVVKEIALGIGALYVYRLRENSFTVHARFFGKLAMGAQTVFVLWIFLCNYAQRFSVGIDQSLLTLVTVIMALAFVQYMYVGVMHRKGYRINHE